MKLCVGVDGGGGNCGVSGANGELGVIFEASLLFARAVEEGAKEGSPTSDRPDREGATEVSLENWPLP